MIKLFVLLMVLFSFSVSFADKKIVDLESITNPLKGYYIPITNGSTTSKVDINTFLGTLVDIVNTSVVSANTAKIGTPNSNTSFESTGFMIATGNAVGWDDVAYSSIISAKSTGAGSLILTTITGNIQGYAFAIGDSISVTAELSHAWKIGTPISLHFHAMTKALPNANPTYMKWQSEYCWVDLNGTVTTPTVVSNNFTIPANTPQNTSFYIELGDIQTPPPSMVSAHCLAKITRLAATGTETNANPIGLSFGVHGVKDSLGSRTEYVK